MSDAFVYMFIVGSGAASGVAVVGLACYGIFSKIRGKENRNVSKRRGIV